MIRLSDGRFRMYGYEKYVKARLESILNFIRCADFQAKPLGRLGYPLNGQLYLKGEALRAGMGKRGKKHYHFAPRIWPQTAPNRCCHKRAPGSAG